MKDRNAFLRRIEVDYKCKGFFIHVNIGASNKLFDEAQLCETFNLRLFYMQIVNCTHIHFQPVYLYLLRFFGEASPIFMMYSENFIMLLLKDEIEFKKRCIVSSHS